MPVPAPTGLMVEILAFPDRVKITAPRPRFSWIVESGGKDMLQAAYQIRVMEASGKTAWDSGNVLSDQSTAIAYAGDPLAPNCSYQWKVQLWDADGQESVWSAPQSFQTGELREPGGDGHERDRRWLVCEPQRHSGGDPEHRRQRSDPERCHAESAVEISRSGSCVLSCWPPW